MTMLSCATTPIPNCSSYNSHSHSNSFPNGPSHSRVEIQVVISKSPPGSLRYDGRFGARECGHESRKLPVLSASSEDTSPVSSEDEEVSPSPPAIDMKPGEEIDGGRDVGAEAFSLLQTRRFWLGTSVATLVALGGNLGGVTSAILNANPELARNARADLLFPVKGFKRCLETSQGFGARSGRHRSARHVNLFCKSISSVRPLKQDGDAREFVYPASWVGDQRLVYRAVERGERERSLDLPPIRGERRPERRTSDPIVAFGPPGTEGELNVSVVVAPVFPGFSLQMVGAPQEAGELILRKFIAPEGSNKKATLLTAQQRFDASNLYYTLEFTVKGSSFYRHNLSVYCTRNDLLFSLNAQTPEKTWPQVQDQFVEIVNSFNILLS